MERHDFALTMQQELIREIEEKAPEFMVFVKIPYSWLQKHDSHTLIYDWFIKYRKKYQRVGMVEIFEKSSRYSWAPNVIWPPSSQYWLEILRRND